MGSAPEVYWNSHSVLGRDGEVHLLASKLLEERVAVVAGNQLGPQVASAPLTASNGLIKVIGMQAGSGAASGRLQELLRISWP